MIFFLRKPRFAKELFASVAILKLVHNTDEGNTQPGDNSKGALIEGVIETSGSKLLNPPLRQLCK